MSELTPLEASIRRRVWCSSAVVALGYGLCARLFFGLADNPSKGWFGSMFAVMSVAFIFVVPFSIGFLATYLGRVSSVGRAIFFPLLPAMAALIIALMFAWEGLICIILWLPLFALLSMSGGLVAWTLLRMKQDAARGPIVGAVILLPLIVAPLERALPHAAEQRHVATSIVIQADVSAVWREIATVPQIQPEEHSFALSHLIGFPRPIAATLSGTGVGSVRHATFERGVLFIEQVTLWRENEQLEFSIHSDPDTIPAKALDQHVTVGGPYFDVLSGAYSIEQRPAGGVVLHLSSEHRLSTTFNRYAGLWTDFIMRDTQQYILRIIKRRAESRAAK